MPLDLLENIGGRIATRKYDDGEYGIILLYFNLSLPYQ